MFWFNKVRESKQSAQYAELSKGRSLCIFDTPTKGYREHRVNLSVDEIEELILLASNLRAKDNEK